MSEKYDVVIIGSGPAGLAAAFHLSENSRKKILIVEKGKICSGGLLNDCKQNYTYPVGFPVDIWTEEETTEYLKIVESHLKPKYEPKEKIEIYKMRADKLGVTLLDIKQAHVGTDKSISLINGLIAELKLKGVDVVLETLMTDLDYEEKRIKLENGTWVNFEDLILAPGRAGFAWLQDIMGKLGIEFKDNIVDVGIRIELKEIYYPIVRDYYDPKFLFENKVRTFCTNSGSAHVVAEKYDHYYSVNGHSFSTDRKPNGLVNFAMLKTFTLTEPIVSGRQFGEILGQMAMKLSGGRPMMQRIGDFRMGRRSKRESFNDDLYDFKPTLEFATPGDISLATPARILRDIWRALKMLDTIVPGVLHPSTIIYYPEIKTYATRPHFMNDYFMVKNNVYMIGDGAGTSRGITAAWSSGIRAAIGVMTS